jgi:ABC-type antimicrobial peptide transport system permease subunit
LSATTARNLWPGSDPIGRTLLWEVPGIEAVQTLRVVGVAADAQVTALGQIDPYYVYVPGEGSAVLVRGRTDIAATVSGIRASLRAADPTLAVPVLPLEATLDWSRGIAGTVTALFGALGALALLLASVGIYGVVSYAVTGRYREIGVRLALGATASSVLALVLRQTMRPVAIGSVIGVVAASALSQILSSVLFGVSPADPVGLGGAALLVVGVALGAGVLAARPAVNADPTATLRYE